MSDVKVRFTVPAECKPTACCSVDNERFGVALVTPANDGVFVSATDGRCLSVVKMEGAAESPVYLPRGVVAKGKRATRKTPATEATLNGRWECEQKFVQPADYAYRFPPVSQVLPDFNNSDDELMSVTLDVALLQRVVDAVTAKPSDTSKQLVTLLLRRNLETGDTDYDRRAVKDAVAVIGGSGIGLVMPCKTDTETVGGEVQRYIDTAEEFKRTFALPTA